MLMLLGPAPMLSNREVRIGITGMRILKPLRSVGSAIGPRLDVIWRKPLSQIFSNGRMPAASIFLRIAAPNSPSIAAQTVS